VTAEPLAELGRRLKAAREEKGWTLQQAAERTRITAKNLAAIEGGELARFPAAVYVRGFVRSYANALDLDEEAELKRLDEAGFTAPSASVPGSAPSGAEAGGAGGTASADAGALSPLRRVLVTAGVLLLLALVAGVGVRALVRWSRAGHEGPVPPSPFQHSAVPAPGGRQNAPSPAPAAPVPAKAVAPASASAIPMGIALSVTAHALCEMQYQPDSQRARWMTLKPGESAVLKAKAQLRVLIGNPAGVEMSTAQGPVPLPKKSWRAEHLLITPTGIQKLALPVPSSTIQ